MRELLRTNDIVLLSYVRALLEGAGIAVLIGDEHVSSVEGSIAILPRRVLVPTKDAERALGLLRDAGLAAHLPEPDR